MNSDGSIIIDTELDNEGFKQGSEKLLAAIKELSTGITEIGESVKGAFSQVSPVLQGIATSAESVNSILSGTGSAFSQQGQNMQAFATAAGAAGKSMGNATQGVSAYDKQLASVQAKIDKTKAKLAEYYQAVEQIKAGTDEDLTHAQTDEQAANVLDMEAMALESLGQKYSNELSTLSELEAEYQRLTEAKAQAAASGTTTQNADFTNVISGIQNAEAELDKYQAKMDRQTALGASESQWQALGYDISQVSAKAEEYRAILESLKSSGAINSSQFETASTALDGLISRASNMATQIPSGTSGWQTFGSVIGNIGSKAVSAAGALGRFVSNGLKSFTKQSGSAKSSGLGLVKMLTSLKRLMITRLKRMFISAIFNSIKESMQALASFDQRFNQSMSNIKNAASGLGANLSVSLGNIITALEPIITRIISAISTAISYLNALFALLGGKSTVTVAAKQTDSYADSLGGASGAAEELKNQVYGFDELNKRNDTSSSGGGGGGGGGSGDLFEEVPISDLLPAYVNDLFNRLKEAVAAGDWYGVGTIIAEGLNYAMTAVDDWINNTFRPWGVKWAGNIAMVLNGLVAEFDWALLGKMFADGLNAVADIINTFITSFNWIALGAGIATGINSWFDNIDWKLMGITFGNGFNTVILTIYGLVNNLDWVGIGSNIGAFISQWFTSINWAYLAQSIVTGFNGLVAALSNAIVNINWVDVGATLANGFTTLVTGIDWPAVWTLLSNALKSLFGGIATFLLTVDWFSYASSLYQGLVSMLSNVDWIGLIGTLGSLLIALITGAINLLLGAVSGLAQGFADLFRDLGLDGIAGLLEGISNALANISSWIKTNIIDPIVNAVKDFLGIHSPSTVFSEIGGNVISGLLEGISSNWTSITSFFSTALGNLKTFLGEKWNEIKTNAAEKWNGIKENITTAFTNAKETVSKKASEVKTDLSNAWNNIKTNTSTVWNNVKTSISNSISTAKSDVSSGVSNVKNSISNAWSNVSSNTSSKWSGISSFVTSAWSSLRSSVAGVEWGSIGTNMVSGLLSGIQSMWGRVTSWVSDAVERLTAKVRSVLDINSPSRVWAEIGQMLDAGLLGGLKSGMDSVTDMAVQVAEGVTDAVTSESPTMDIIADSTTSGLSMVANKLSDIAETFRDISSSLTAIETFKAPNIAMGTVVPAKTKVADTIETARSADITNFAGDVDERMADLSYLLRQIKDLIQGLNLNVDIEALTKAITKQQRNASLNFGV